MVWGKRVLLSIRNQRLCILAPTIKSVEMDFQASTILRKVLASVAEEHLPVPELYRLDRRELGEGLMLSWFQVTACSLLLSTQWIVIE